MTGNRKGGDGQRFYGNYWSEFRFLILHFFFIFCWYYQVRRVSRFLVKTISAPLPQSEPTTPSLDPAAGSVAFTPAEWPAVPEGAPPPTAPPAEANQQVIQPAIVPAAPAVPAVPAQTAPVPTAANGSDVGQAFVTVALSINISANGVYATSRCSSPARTASSAASGADPALCSSSIASVPLKLALGEAGGMRSGVNSLPSSHPPTPQAVPAVDTYLMDLQHKLASLSMANSQQQQPSSIHPQGDQAAPQLPSPTSSTKEGSPQLTMTDPPVALGPAPGPAPPDQVDQAAGAAAVENKPLRKVLPSTIDIHDLETELAKLHSQGKVKEVPPVPAEGSTGSTTPAVTAVTLTPPVGGLPATTTTTTTVLSSPPEPVVIEAAEPGAMEPRPKSPPEAPAIPAVMAHVATEQKAIQTEPQQVLLQPTAAPAAQPPGRKISRFSVTLVDEKVGPDQPLPQLPPQGEEVANDPELQELLARQETERKALARKHEDELAAFRARRKLQLHQPVHPQQLPRSQETSRTPSPGSGRPTSSNAGHQSSSTNCSTPNSSVPGTPTRQANRTFTDDLLRLVQDLGNKAGLEKNKTAGDGGEKAKAPTLNQLRAGGTGTGTGSNGHSLTQTAGTATAQSDWRAADPSGGF